MTPGQIQRIEAGENIEAVIEELDSLPPEMKARLIQNPPPALSEQQKADLLFLSGGLLDGIGLEARQAILQLIKEKEEKITYEDLVALGIFAPGTLAEKGSWERWWQERDLNNGPAQATDLLEWQYGLNLRGLSVDALDRIYRDQQHAESAQFTSMMVGLAVGALVDRWLYGPELELLPGGDGRFNFGEPTGAGEGGQQIVAGSGDYESNMASAYQVDVSTGENQAVFYSGPGNQALAEVFARENGKMTLEMTPGGKYFDSLKLFDSGSPLTKEQARGIWSILSQ